MSISSSLQSIYDSKQAIKASLINKGKEPTDVLSTYSSLIDAIETGGSQVKYTEGDFFFQCGVRATDITLNDLDTSEMTSMYCMFDQCNRVSTIDISEWNMTKVTNMALMFNDCDADYLVLGTLMPTALTWVFSMFSGSKFKALDLHNLPIDNIADLSHFFSHCTELESINLTGWNTSNVTRMVSLFWGCSKLTSVDLSSFNTSKVTNMNGLFCDCSKLTSVDLSSFDTSNVTEMNSLFSGCSSLTSVDLSSFDTSSCIVYDNLFKGDVLLTSVTGFSIDYSSDDYLHASDAFTGCSSLTSLLFKSGGTMYGNSTYRGIAILDLSSCTAFTESSVVAMINSCSANTSGYERGFKLASSVYSLLTEDDIALFTAKNYTVSA